MLIATLSFKLRVTTAKPIMNEFITPDPQI